MRSITTHGWTNLVLFIEPGCESLPSCREKRKRITCITCLHVNHVAGLRFMAPVPTVFSLLVVAVLAACMLVKTLDVKVFSCCKLGL